MILTVNEKEILRFLASGIKHNKSMNEIAKECSVSPGGAFKILTKLKKEGILKSEQIANIKSYNIDFDSAKTRIILELALIPDLEGRVKLRAEDFAPLQKVAKACVLFGSYASGKQNPGDLDVLFVLDKNNFVDYKKALSKVQQTTPVKIHDVIQTEDDLKANIRKKDKIVMEAIRKGVLLWGFDVIAEAVSSAE